LEFDGMARNFHSSTRSMLFWRHGGDADDATFRAEHAGLAMAMG
jgi:hypothetical protein